MILLWGMIIMNKRISFTVPLLLTITISTLLSGCATKGGMSPPNDPLDSCNNYVQAIVRNGESSSTFTLTLTNELDDLTSVSLETLMRGGDFEFSDWFKSRGQKHLYNLRRNGGITKLMNSINNSAIEDTKTINQLNRDIAALNHCRQNLRRSINNNYRAGKISRLEAKNQLSEQQQKIDRDNSYIAQLLGHSGSRISSYQDTLREIGGSTTATIPSYGPGTRYVSYRTLNIRSSPSSTNNGNILGTLSRGTPVSVQQSVGNWLTIDYQGRSAYIWAKSTNKNPVQGTPTTASSESSSSTQQTTSSVQNAQNAQRDGEQKNEELARLKREIEEDLAILKETAES